MSEVSIIITGFMGSGKTTVAFALARMLEYKAIDLDRLITKNAGRTPKRIIKDDGESAFREIETRLLGDALSQSLAKVIALGGGAWTVRKNRDLIARHDGVVVWLDAPFALCWERIMAGGQKRPLAHSFDRAQELYKQRRPLYKLARLRVPVAGKAVDETALFISRRLALESISASQSCD